MESLEEIIKWQVEFGLSKFSFEKDEVRFLAGFISPTRFKNYC